MNFLKKLFYRILLWNYHRKLDDANDDYTIAIESNEVHFLQWAAGRKLELLRKIHMTDRKLRGVD